MNAPHASGHGIRRMESWYRRMASLAVLPVSACATRRRALPRGLTLALALAVTACVNTPRNNTHVEDITTPIPFQGYTTFLVPVQVQILWPGERRWMNWGSPMLPSADSFIAEGDVKWYPWNTSVTLPNPRTSSTQEHKAWVRTSADREEVKLRVMQDNVELAIFEKDADNCYSARTKEASYFELIQKCKSKSSPELRLTIACGKDGQVCCNQDDRFGPRCEWGSSPNERQSVQCDLTKVETFGLCQPCGQRGQLWCQPSGTCGRGLTAVGEPPICVDCGGNGEPRCGRGSDNPECDSAGLVPDSKGICRQRNTWDEGAVNGVNWEHTGDALWLSELAYGEGYSTETLRQCAARNGYGFYAYFEDDNRAPDSEMLVVERSDRIVFAIQGTQGVHDALTDVAARQATWRGVKVHAGFYRQARGLFPLVQRSLNALGVKDREVWLTGHSLGGAVSQILAVMLVDWYRDAGMTPPNLQIITFGSPRVGDGDWVRLYDRDRQLNWNTVRWVNQNDVVPNVPKIDPSLLAIHPLGPLVDNDHYAHAGRRFQIHGDTRRECRIPGGLTESEFREAHPGERAPCYDSMVYRIERDAAEYSWSLLDSSTDAHHLHSDLGYSGILKRLVPANHAAALVHACEDETSTVDVPPPVNGVGCRTDRPICCESAGQGRCLAGACVSDPISCK